MHKPDVIVVTGEMEFQVFSCHRAFQAFYTLGHTVQLENIKNGKHEYNEFTTELVWNFFKNSPHEVDVS